MREMAEGRGGAKVPEQVERFIRQLLVTYKAAILYPPASDIPRDCADGLVAALQQLLADRPDLRFSVTKEAIFFDDGVVLPGQHAFEALAKELYQRQVAEVRFHAGATSREVLHFLRALVEPAETIVATGGFEQRLWDLQVDGITVRTLETRVIDIGGLEEEGEVPIPDRAGIDRLLDDPRVLQPREQRVLLRFAGDAGLLSRYLIETAEAARLEGRPASRVADRVTSLAHLASAAPEEARPLLLAPLARSLLDLDPGLRRSVLAERLLPDARLDDALLSVISELGLSELCDALVEGADVNAVAREGLSRAIRTLIALNLHTREEVLGAAGAAMRGLGVDEELAASVVRDALPARIRVSAPQTTTDDETRQVLRLLDLAPVQQDEADDEQTLVLRQEASYGVSDGDILLRLVMLVVLTEDDAAFAPLMQGVQNSLMLLLEMDEYVDAADSVDALVALERDPRRSEWQRDRTRAALAAMADVDSLRAIVMATRSHQPGTPELEACVRLLTTLGSRTITPLLELLAEERDMSLRKNLVALVSSTAAGCIGELAARLDDPRWYFVRNVVSILGSTRDPEAVTHLIKVLRHPDSRVRREAVRALAGTGGPVAERALISALADADANNVALAARYLGAISSTAAVDALASVARGTGGGAAEAGARVEAVEALGRLATPDAEAALTEVAHRRGVVSRARSRELRAAAEAALASIGRLRQEGGE